MKFAIVAGLALAIGSSVASAQTVSEKPEPTVAEPDTAPQADATVSGDRLIADLLATKACNPGKLMDCAKLDQSTCDVAMAAAIPECVDALRPDLAGKQLDSFDVSFVGGRFQGCLLARTMKASKVAQSKVMSCLMGR